MQMGTALASGAGGACVLTLLHETARGRIAHAPQVHVIAERAMKKSARRLGRRGPRKQRLYQAALAGDIVANSIYYALAGLGGPRNAVGLGALLGAVGGVGAFALPERIGLGRLPDRDTPATELMTLAWYTAGGIAAGLLYRALAGRRGTAEPHAEPRSR